MKEFHIRIDSYLFERIKLLSEKYKISINQIIIELLETGYIKFMEVDYESKNFNK